MYDPKHLITQFLTENFCSCLCNYLAPNNVHCDKIVGKDKALLLIYRTNMCQRHILLQIYKDARSFWEIPLRNRNRVRVFLTAHYDVNLILRLELVIFGFRFSTNCNGELVMGKEGQSLIVIKCINSQIFQIPFVWQLCSVLSCIWED